MRIVRGGLVASGIAAMAFALGGLWIDRVHTRPWLGARDLWSFWLGGALLHDVLVAPIALVVAFLVHRLVPAVARPAVLAALFASAVITLISLPALRGYGRRPANPTILPRDYLAGLLVTLSVVWAVALFVVVIGTVRRRPANT